MNSCRTYVAAVDCGTTAIKAALVDCQGGMHGLWSVLCSPAPGGEQQFEFDALKLVRAVSRCLRQAVARSQIRPCQVAAVAISSQRATIVPVDAQGAALMNAISWQDMRGSRQIRHALGGMSPSHYYRITGLQPHPVFSLAKILWMRSRLPALYKKTSCFLLLPDLLLRAWGGVDNITDFSSASLTGLFDVARLGWSALVLDVCGIDHGKLPRIAASGTIVGTMSAAAGASTGLLSGTPLVLGGGDQQCAALGAGGIEEGVATISLGTAAAPMCCTRTPCFDRRMRVTCCAHVLPGRWNIEGLQNTAGASLRWLSGIINGGEKLSPQVLREAEAVPPGADGVLFYPYLDGAAAPLWNPQATARFLGLTLAHGRAHLVRAVMEGVAMRSRQILDVFQAMGLAVRQVRLAGGGATYTGWNDIMAGVLGLPTYTASCPHASLAGAAILAAAGAGAFATIPAAAEAMAGIARRYRTSNKCAAAYDRVYRDFGRYASLRLAERVT